MSVGTTTLSMSQASSGLHKPEEKNCILTVLKMQFLTRRVKEGVVWERWENKNGQGCEEWNHPSIWILAVRVESAKALKVILKRFALLPPFLPTSWTLIASQNPASPLSFWQIVHHSQIKDEFAHEGLKCLSSELWMK